MSSNETMAVSSEQLRETAIPSRVVNLNIYFGVSFVIGVVLFGYITVNNSCKCKPNRLYLCECSMTLTALLIIASIYRNNYYGYVMFAIAYGLAIGSFQYMFKVLVFSQVKAKAFSKAWSYVQCVQSLSLLIGIPLTGYINIWCPSSSYQFGFILSAIFCIVGCITFVLIAKTRIMAPHNKKLFQHSCNTTDKLKISESTAKRFGTSGQTIMKKCSCGRPATTTSSQVTTKSTISRESNVSVNGRPRLMKTWTSTPEISIDSRPRHLREKYLKSISVTGSESVEYYAVVSHSRFPSV